MQSSTPLVATEDKLHDGMIAELKATYKNMEPFLMKRKFPTERKQESWLNIYCKAGGLLSYHGQNHFVFDLQADLETILELVQYPDLERIEGVAYPPSGSSMKIRCG
jgi:hypothetical protein